MRIEGRTVVVTGASRGIGKAAAKALARGGGRIALLARSHEVQQVAADIVAQGGQARGYACDLGKAAEVDRVAQQIVADFGHPDIVFNNAGAGRWLHVEETPAEEVVAMMAAPYFAAFHVTRAFLPAMLDAGRGYIVNINSAIAWLPWPGATGYLSARWAMRGFTESLRSDLRGTGIQVLEIVPGEVASTYFEHNPQSHERMPRITKLVPTLTPEQVADILVRAIERDRHRIVIPRMLKLVLMLRALAPAPVDWIMWRTGARRAERRRENAGS